MHEITKDDFLALRNDLHERIDMLEREIVNKVVSRVETMSAIQTENRRYFDESLQEIKAISRELPKRVADEAHQQVLAQVKPIDDKIEKHMKPDNPFPHPKQKQSIPAWQIIMICLTIAVTGSLVGSQLIPIKNEIAEVKSALNIHLNETK